MTAQMPRKGPDTFAVNAGWQPEAIDQTTRLRAYRLPRPRIEPSFESFEPFGLDSAH